MKFKFGLETVLKHRERLEEGAQRDYAEAQAAVDRCLKELEDMYTRLDETRDEILGLQRQTGARSLDTIRAMESFIGGHKIRIEQKRYEARGLLAVAEEKQEELILRAREKKVLVQLKETKLAEHREWLGKMEAKELDDMTNMRQAWGKR